MNKLLLTACLFAVGSSPILGEDQKASIVTGIIYEDTNENGSRDDDEPVTEGAQVSLLKMPSKKAIYQQFTDAEGAYTFVNVPAGTYPLQIVFPTGKRVVTKPLTVKEGGGKVFVSVPLTASAGSPRFASAATLNPANTPRSNSEPKSATVKTKPIKEEDEEEETDTLVKNVVPPTEVMSPSAP